MKRAAIRPLGEAAYLVVLGERVDVAVNRRVHTLADAVRAARTAEPGLGEPVPAYASLLVPFEPDLVEPADVERRLADLVASVSASAAADEGPTGPPLEIPVRYGGDDGPDLPEVAERLGLAEREVVEHHAEPLYRVFLLGFAPGFGYLGPLPAELALPRRATPRPRVPAGSVGIAGGQTAVYPVETPGGWHLIGRTDLPLWDPRRDPPALLRPGGRVRFVPLAGRGDPSRRRRGPSRRGS